MFDIRKIEKELIEKLGDNPNYLKVLELGDKEVELLDSLKTVRLSINESKEVLKTELTEKEYTFIFGNMNKKVESDKVTEGKIYFEITKAFVKDPSKYPKIITGTYKDKTDKEGNPKVVNGKPTLEALKLGGRQIDKFIEKTGNKYLILKIKGRESKGKFYPPEIKEVTKEGKELFGIED